MLYFENMLGTMVEYWPHHHKIKCQCLSIPAGTRDNDEKKSAGRLECLSCCVLQTKYGRTLA